MTQILPNPAVLVNSQPTTNGVDVNSGDVVVIQLLNHAGVDTWTCQCVSTDELQNKTTVNAGVVIDNVNRTATFTMPTEYTGVALIFESIVNQGIYNGVRNSALANRIKICTVSGNTGERVMAVDETTEGNAEFGWITTTNYNVRYGSGGGGGGPPTGPAGGDLGSTYPNPTVIDLTISGETRGDVLFRNATNWTRLPAGTDGYVLTTHAAGSDPTWSAGGGGGGAPSGPAGGDLTGTYPNPTIDVNKVTFAKFQQITTDRLLGRDTASTGNVEELTVSGGLEFTGSGGIQRSAISGDVTISAGATTAIVTDLTITSEAQGDILYRNASNWVRLPAGTDGYVLTTHSTGQNPTWTTNSASPSGAAGGDLTGTYPDPTIGTNKVTFAKMQQIATNSLLGRDTASTGNVENILLNATLEMDGSLNLQRAALTGDVTASAGSNALTIANNAVTTVKILDANVTLAKLANGTALSVLGRSANSSGVYADMAAGTDANIMRRSGTTIGFGSIDLSAAGAVGSSLLPFANITSLAGLSVFGRSANTTGVMAAITAANDGEVLRRNGTSIGFGTITLAGLANATACSVLGRSANSSGVYADISIGTNDHVLKRTSNVVGSGFIVNANVDAAAAIAGTKIAPDFGSQNVITTGNLSVGSTPATAGNIRLPNTSIIAARNATNTADINALVVDSSNRVHLSDGYILMESAIISGRRAVALANCTQSGETSATQLPTGTGDGIIFVYNCQTAPTANSSGGGIFYVVAGALYWRGTSGTITQIAIA